MTKHNLRIVFFGTPAFAVPVLQALRENFEVIAVVTAPDQKVGRKQILTPSPVKLATQVFDPESQTRRGLALERVYTPEKLNQDFLTSHFPLLTSDLFIVAAYGKIIPQFILDIPKFGALNIHPSLLPKYRGPSPLQSGILKGDKASGISIIKMDFQMDHGPIIFTKPFSLSNTDTFETLSKKSFLDAAAFLPQVIRDFIEGKLKETLQDESLATYCKMITKESAFFDIANPPDPEILDRMIRAYYPWPNVWTRWNEKIVKFLPGGLVQMEGKKPVKLEDFLNGHSGFPIKALDKE
ncbi:methionyl-tRNA formyltransferase [Candidatus Daviesbacteria bacterium RIFOXYD1_FULL_41_10]|uniref:Methionyl-tRNA formyltransferase n=2 Tax=Candidatus Daviesiibacteriota TaxID=1752718 RepID=A0A1F5N0V9_9BACT|nr:MAG: Methionyl-tRNA formyltransferase [Candidatus Daviesbacteria bacterium GW2011_GWB1_41_5]OGE71254.1 MAG: methionyl-tRNA formyltransferase [Candidatus Daviesbacteria bacterium RIFOXYD1_FULL_41_10]